MVTTELDLKKLSQDIATLRKNRENVPLELLKTKYKKPYAKLKEEIRAQFEIYMKHIIVLGILKTGPDLTGAKAESMVNQIQKIIDEEKAAGHQKEVTHAVFEEFNLAKAENLACGYYTDRVKYEAYAPYWLEHIHQGPDGKVTSDLLPGMTWHPEAGVWVSFSEPSFTLMMPPTQAGIDAQHKEDTERFKKYQMAHGNERSQYHPDILPGRREIPAGIIHAHGRPDGHKLPGDQHRKQETGRRLPRNRTGSAGSGRIRRGRAYLTGGQP